jgi:hypothetical protein
MIETFEKLGGLLIKPVLFAYQYFRRQPEITLSMKNAGSSQGAMNLPGRLRLEYWSELVLHNDSPFLVRGIKLLSPFPKSWRLEGEVPTRLEPDQKLSIKVDVVVDRDHQELLNQFGESMRQRLASAVWPELLSAVHVEFELKNEHGRTVYQYTTFSGDGKGISKIFSKRRANVS